MHRSLSLVPGAIADRDRDRRPSRDSCPNYGSDTQPGRDAARHPGSDRVADSHSFSDAYSVTYRKSVRHGLPGWFGDRDLQGSR